MAEDGSVEDTAANPWDVEGSDVADSAIIDASDRTDAADGRANILKLEAVVDR